ncbi:hypothetical protein [Pseudovibrio exalbescens]|uniref:hypothetical protein n=1 Tax=Pseudovibrio exalbescens TaxID=197461 RepID=UPI000C9CD263|nr:hypothetical protein [Pseudovibrio exalbescens]
MLKQIIAVISDNYGTYVNAITKTRERHAPRLAAQIIIGLILAFSLSELSENSISVVITSLSILAGFSFSAMFPIASDITSNLREPQHSEDHDDLKRLSLLANSFRANVSYFIPLTLLTIVVFTSQMLDLEFPSEIFLLFKPSDTALAKLISAIDLANYILAKFIIFLSVILFLEVIYTFYRMCFTVIYMLKIREEYRSY